jgi:hydrogenase maturation factor
VCINCNRTILSGIFQPTLNSVSSVIKVALQSFSADDPSFLRISFSNGRKRKNNQDTTILSTSCTPFNNFLVILNHLMLEARLCALLHLKIFLLLFPYHCSVLDGSRYYLFTTSSNWWYAIYSAVIAPVAQDQRLIS